VRVEKQFTFGQPGEIRRPRPPGNTSIAPEAATLDLSYRVHNYLHYGPQGTTFWSSDGTTMSKWDDVSASYTVPQAGLSEHETEQLFTQDEVATARRLVTFGDYHPQRHLLLR